MSDSSRPEPSPFGIHARPVAIHEIGVVGKTRAAIENAWKHAADYRSLLFIAGDTSEGLHGNLAALNVMSKAALMAHAGHLGCQGRGPFRTAAK